MLDEGFIDTMRLNKINKLEERLKKVQKLIDEEKKNIANPAHERLSKQYPNLYGNRELYLKDYENKKQKIQAEIDELRTKMK